MNTKYLIIGFIVLIVVLLGGAKIMENQDSGVNGQANVSGNVGGTREAPAFTLSKLGGGSVTLADYRGEKPVILDFFATWCPNCRRDMPKLNKLYEKYKDDVEVLGVNLQESEKTVEEFISSRNISFPIVFDLDGQVSRTFGIRYTNTHVLINKEGHIVRVVLGDIKESDVLSLFEQKRE